MECAYRKIAGYTTIKIGIKKKLGMCSLENCQLHNPIKVGINKLGVCLMENCQLHKSIKCIKMTQSVTYWKILIQQLKLV